MIHIPIKILARQQQSPIVIIDAGSGAATPSVNWIKFIYITTEELAMIFMKELRPICKGKSQLIAREVFRIVRNKKFAMCKDNSPLSS